MFNFFKKSQSGESDKNVKQVTFKINGMHCTSCSLNIDGALEETAGVVESATSYAGATARVSYDPEKVSEVELQKVIEGLGYRVNS